MVSYSAEFNNPLKSNPIQSEEPRQSTATDTGLAGIGPVINQTRLPCIRTSGEDEPNVAADSRPVPAIGRSTAQGQVRIVGREGFQIERRALIPLFWPKSSRRRLSGAMPALAFCAVAVGGCAPGLSANGIKMGAANPPPPRARIAQIPLPNSALLQRQRVPDCAFTGQASSPPTAEEARQKLDYEQQCYRQSEIIVRRRLDQLQDSVHEMIKAARQR
jgi:hypothetical protein